MKNFTSFLAATALVSLVSNQHLSCIKITLKVTVDFRSGLSGAKVLLDRDARRPF